MANKLYGTPKDLSLGKSIATLVQLRSATFMDGDVLAFEVAPDGLSAKAKALGEACVGKCVLVLQQEFECTLRFEKLVDAKAVPADLELSLLLSPPRNSSAAVLCWKNALQSKSKLSATQIESVLSEELSGRIQFLLKGLAWSDAIVQLRQAEFWRETINKAMFDFGIQFSSIQRVHADSKALRKSEMKELEIGLKERDLQLEKKELALELERANDKSNAEIEEIRLEEKKNKELLEQEAKRMEEIQSMKAELEKLQHQQALKFNKLRKKSAAKRKERLDEYGLSALLEEVQDSSMRVEFMKMLVEKEMSPEQLAAKYGQGKEQEPYIEGCATESQSPVSPSILNQSSSHQPSQEPKAPKLSGYKAFAGAAKATKVSYILGEDSLYSLDLTESDSIANAALHRFRIPVKLGNLKSLTVQESDPNKIYIGGEKGVACFEPKHRKWSYSLYSGLIAQKTAANSMVAVRGGVLVAHSHRGLHLWRHGARKLAAVKGIWRNMPTSFLQVINKDKYIFASKDSVYMGLSNKLWVDPNLHVKLPEEISCLRLGLGGIIAGTLSGKLYLISACRHDYRQIDFSFGNPIFDLQPLGNSSIAVASGMPWFDLIDSSGELMQRYSSLFSIRCLSVSGESVISVDRSGQKLLAWSHECIQGPNEAIQFDSKIQAICMRGG